MAFYCARAKATAVLSIVPARKPSKPSKTLQNLQNPPKPSKTLQNPPNTLPNSHPREPRCQSSGNSPKGQRVVACSAKDKDCGWVRSGGDKKTKMGGRKGSGLNRRQHPLWDSSLQSLD